MKIVMITPYYPPIIGGITNYVLYLTMSLKKINNEVIVITRMGDKNTDVLAINKKKILFVFISFTYLLKIKPDVIHSHGGWHILFPGVIYKTFFPDTKLIQSEHTEPSYNMNFFVKTIIKFLYSRCNWITYDSRITKDILEKYFKIPVNNKNIRGGVYVSTPEDTDVNFYINKFCLNESKNAPLIAYLGPLVWKNKVEGVKRLIMGFNIVINKYPNAMLIIIGDGEYRKELEKLVNNLCIEKNIIFTGFVKNPHALMSICDIYAHISLMDSFPLSILEAMYMRLPVIASNVGDIPELVKNNETGILVNSDEKSIAKSIIDLWNDKGKMKMIAENGNKLVIDEYNWDKIAESYLEIYK